MAFDYKKEYRAFYLPKQQPQILEVPEMQFVAVEGQGDPNVPDGEYQASIETLYSIAYTVKMSKKGTHQMEGYFDFVVPPLEGFWWQEGTTEIDYARKDDFRWISVIRLPEFVTREEFAWAVTEAERKKQRDFSGAFLWTLEEGLCVQCMHLGPYDEEPVAVERMDAYLEEQGFEPDFTAHRRHHEIYLTDARKTAPEKLKTVLRHPIRPKC